MAAKKKANGPVPRKRAKKALTKADPNFYHIIGQRGGRKTADIKGAAFFSRISALRHSRNREKKLLDRDE